MSSTVWQVSGSLDVKAIMDSWIKQKGYPVVTMRSMKMKKSSIPDQIVVSQERFLIDPSLDKKTRKNEIGQLSWFIPLTFITQNSDKEQMIWLNKTSSKCIRIKREEGDS